MQTSVIVAQAGMTDTDGEIPVRARMTPHCNLIQHLQKKANYPPNTQAAHPRLTCHCCRCSFTKKPP